MANALSAPMPIALLLLVPMNYYHEREIAAAIAKRRAAAGTVRLATCIVKNPIAQVVVTGTQPPRAKLHLVLHSRD